MNVDTNKPFTRRQRFCALAARTAAFAFALFALVVLTLGASAFAQPADPTNTGVTFLKAERYEPQPLCCNYSATDQPLTVDAYDYNVALKQGCTIYTGRYERFDDYFPAYHTGQPVKAEIDKRIMVLFAPSGEPLKMPIIDRTKAPDCGGK